MELTSNISSVKAPRRAASSILVAAVSIILTLVVMLPLDPGMPVEGLDASWLYAINEAVARHLIFGKDLIFTYGPLGSVDTWFYHPGTDRVMLIGGAIVAIGFCSGFALLALERRPGLLAVMPFLVVILNSRDAILMALPVFLLLACFLISSASEDPLNLPLTRRTKVLLALLVCSIGILPLVKGSFSGVAGALGFLSIAILIRNRRGSLAVVLTALSVLTLCFAWVLTGQPLLDLPGFFISQGPIISGYTDAMSSSGPFSSVVYWGVPAAICVLAFYASLGRHRGIDGLIVTAGIAVYLFITFKAGFVRQDGHPIISIGALAIIAYALATMLQPKVALIVSVVALCGWWSVERQIADIRPQTVLERLHLASAMTVDGIDARMHGDTLLRRFNYATEQIRAQFPLPATAGTVDLYPNDLSQLFANKLIWSGRPVFQSYSAYTPELAKINRDHLRDAGPARVFFSVGPIDLRYPSIEDASSWPDLIAHYAPTGFIGQYAILDRRSGSNAITISEPFQSGEQALGSSVPLRQRGGAVWAQIDVKPTLLGKLVSALFKNPFLSIVVKYSDGTTKNFRFVPGMARDGFLLSPTVSSARDFVALQSPRAAYQLQGKYPTEFGISGSSGTRWLWNKSFAYRLSAMTVTPDHQVDRILASLDSTASENHEKLSPGGDCNIELVNQAGAGTAPVQIGDKPLSISGWAAVSGKGGIKSGKVDLALTRPDGTVQLWSTNKTPRGDVADYFHQPALANSGFEAAIDGEALKGTYSVSVIQEFGRQHLECKGTVTLTR
jgi:hypothetical protein